MAPIIKNNIFGIMITLVVFAGFYVSFVLGQRSVNPNKSSAAAMDRKSSPRQRQPRATASGTESIATLMDSSASTFYGEAVAYAELKVQSEQGGKIVYLQYKEGDNVKQKELMVKFDTTKLDLQIERAVFERKALQAQIKDAEVNLQTCKINWQRAKTLFNRGATSKEELEKSDNALDAAKSSLRKAQEALNQANISLKLLREQRKEYQVHAAITGIVNKRYYNLNEVYKSGDVIYHLVNIDKMDINVRVSENYITRIHPGVKARVVFSALNHEYPGVVEKLPPGSSEDKYNFTVKVVVANADHKIRPGMFAKVVFAIASKTKAAPQK